MLSLPVFGSVHFTGREESELQMSQKIFESEGNVNEECRIFQNFAISAAHLVHLQ